MAFSISLPASAFIPADGAFTEEANNLNGLNFPASGTPEAYSVPFVLPSAYGAGTITASIHHYTPSNASGTVIFNATIRALDGNADRAFPSAQTATHTRSGGITAIEIETITFSSAQIDGAVAGDLVQLQLIRNGGTVSGNATVISVELSEA